MIKASFGDKKLVEDILVSAFEPKTEENSINLVVKQDKKRIQRMRILMGYLFERAILFGEVFLSDDKRACLLVNYSQNEKTSLRTILLDVKLGFKCIGFTRIYKVLKRQSIGQKYAPKGNHIKPIILGVKNEYKGKGTAARFMLEIKNHFKANKLPVIIDAAAMHNVKLYEKFGFKVFDKEESLGFPIYFLRIN